jgi:thiamine-monophosphate kinase
LVGPGDDAAVLAWRNTGDCVVTTDMLTEGVDFRLEEADPRRIGRKALAVNLSDLAAMGAVPVSVVVSLALPRTASLELAWELYEGLLPLAEEFDTLIAGGDTNAWDGGLVINVTAIGRTTERGPLLRSGARAGDAIVVTGDFGGSILGKHLDFTPRVREALHLRANYDVHAAMDVSDGLTLDLSRMCEESGCGAELDLAAIPISRAAHEAAGRDATAGTPLERALGDGEDFELLLAMPPDEARRLSADKTLGVPVTIIGRFVAEGGLTAVEADGVRRPLAPRGYEHRFGA